MTLKSNRRLKSIIKAIDHKLGAKTVNLASGVKILRSGYAPAAANLYAPAAVRDTRIKSVCRLAAVLDDINQKTGCNDSTLTNAVQRLVDGYTADIPLYSFGAISDVHIQYETGIADLQRALTYLKDRVPFTCVCGDLVSKALPEYMAAYKNCVDNFAGDMPLFECAGNHETYNAEGKDACLDLDLWKNTTGKDPYYSFTYGSDVFIFLSLDTASVGSKVFTPESLDWLAQTLEENRNKRCFVWQHCQDPEDDCADPSHTYSPLLKYSAGQRFLSLIRHYKNTIWFHGHTHLTFHEPTYPVGEDLGYRSVHIPSLVSPRVFDPEENAIKDYFFDSSNNKIWGSTLSEGYIVDVYPSRIVLRGMNFAAGESKTEVEPFADEIYTLDTTLQTVEAGTCRE